MNNKENKIWKDFRGTALLIALLVMGVFIAVSIALFGLLFREVRGTKNHISSGRAYYAAESGVEEALYYLDTKLPGWEGTEDSNQGQLDSDVKFAYQIDNRCGTYPCFKPDEYDIYTILNSSPEKLYEELALSANTIIPMFVVEEDGTVKSIKNFVVQFFAGFDPNQDLNLAPGFDISGWDVLRWKIFGMKQDVDGNYVTDSIDDFTAVSSMHNQITGEDYNSTAKDPSWFGSYDCSDLSDVEVVFDKDFTIIGKEGITCTRYSDVANEPGYGTNSGTTEACTNLQARDYYNYENGKVTSISGCYNIFDFMDGHMNDVATGLNYISLANIMNPAMFKTDEGVGLENYLQKRDKSKIFFRLEAFDDVNDEMDTDQFVRDTAEIVSRGFSGDSKQSIEVKLKRGTYMPVFNFAIYSTTGSQSGNYYQEEEQIIPE